MKTIIRELSKELFITRAGSSDISKDELLSALIVIVNILGEMADKIEENEEHDKFPSEEN